MKFIKALLKNFKVLFRLKTALLAIIFGPLLVIFLIGFAFNSTNAIQLTVGYNAPDNSTLTTEFIHNLENKYTTKTFEDQATCIRELELGIIHTCIFFPEDFVISKDKRNNVTFVVDKSRVNLAYTVIESISEQIGIKTDELSKDLTQTLTNTLTKTGTIVDSTIGSLIKVKKDMNDNIADATSISSELNGVDLTTKEVTFTGLDDIASIDKSLYDIQKEVEDIITDNIPLIEDLNGSTSVIIADLEDLNKTVFEEYNSSSHLIDTISTKISVIQKDISDVKKQMKTAKENTDKSREKINTLETRLTSLNQNIDSIKSDLESLSRDVNSIEITSSDQIINPINTKIETITSDNNQLISLLPYLLMLIVMFVGLMLASTLVVVEKSSRASFRVFTTPTKDAFFLFSTFVTAFIIVIAQLAVIMGVISYFLIDVFTANLLVNAIILILASSIFIMAGMAVGYLIKSQQGANMTSISIGALFLMLSNFVLPIESIIPALRVIADYNPFVLASETLRRSTIFSMQLKDMMPEISILLGVSVIIFILILISQKFAKARYFKRNQHSKAKKIKENKGLWIKNVLVYEEKEFIQEIHALSDSEYNKFVKNHSIKIRKFIKKELKKPLIANNIRKYSKSELLKQIIKEKEDILNEIKKKHAQRIKETKELNNK